MTISIKILQRGDETVLANVAPDVFDNEINIDLTKEFINDPRHHIAVAIEDGLVIGFASAVHYLHPDKHPELWINEVGVASTHQRRGLGKALLSALFAVGRELGCSEAWVLTERSNIAAMRLYSSLNSQEGPNDLVMHTFQLTRENASK